MLYTEELIDKIYNLKSISNKEKIDRLLEIDAIQYTNCGLETTKSDKLIVKKNSKYIYKIIKKIDNNLGITLLQPIDK